MIRTSTWLGRVLFVMGCSLAGMLVAVVGLAPLVVEATEGDGSGTWHRVVALFAHDTALRRTSLASAGGLLVTACVFFRSSKPIEHEEGGQVPPPRQPPMVGGAGA